MPVMWILAGNNGAGKTTLARNVFGELVSEDAIWLNPDHLADEFVGRYTDLNTSGGRFYANLGSAALNDARMDNFIEHAHGSFVVETVLSSDKFIKPMSKVEPRSRIVKAKDNGFQITMVYVLLNSPELAIQRVKDRVAMGGHHVDPAKITERWYKSQENLVRLIPILDELWIFDNSGRQGEQVLVAGKNGQALTIHEPDRLPHLQGLIAKAR